MNRCFECRARATQATESRLGAAEAAGSRCQDALARQSEVSPSTTIHPHRCFLTFIFWSMRPHSVGFCPIALTASPPQVTESRLAAAQEAWARQTEVNATCIRSALSILVPNHKMTYAAPNYLQ